MGKFPFPIIQGNLIVIKSIITAKDKDMRVLVISHGANTTLSYWYRHIYNFYSAWAEHQIRIPNESKWLRIYGLLLEGIQVLLDLNCKKATKVDTIVALETDLSGFFREWVPCEQYLIVYVSIVLP